MVWSHSDGSGDRLKNAELVDYCVKNFFGGHFQFLATEIFSIEKTRMRSNGNPASLSSRNCDMHGIGIARVKTSCDVRRADELKQLGIMSGAFTEIGVKIDSHAHESRKLSPIRKRSSSRSR